MKRKPITTSFTLREGDTNELRDIAFNLGYRQTTGVAKGLWGNVSLMLRAIATSLLLVVDPKLLNKIKSIYFTYLDADTSTKYLLNHQSWEAVIPLFESLFKPEACAECGKYSLCEHRKVIVNPD